MKRRGFAFMEVFVIISMITLLMVLLLPAIERARQDARRVQCKNNLKQLGLACHNYHEALNQFPNNYDGRPALEMTNNDAQWQGGTGCFGWIVMALPYMDQAPLYNQFNFSDQSGGSS